MIHLFRRIRQEFLTENRASKYLVYAFGEILLVVIGILIALQVNNWNETRIQRSEEKRILLNISDEIKDAISSRETIRDTYQDRRDLLSSTLDKLYSDESILLTDEECSALYRSHMADWNPFNISTLEELVTTGKISILSNDELRKLLLLFRNLAYSNQVSLEKVMYEAIVLVDDYPFLIERNWDPGAQTSTFICHTGEMKKDKYFLAHLQSNRGRMNSPLNVASQELNMLNKIAELLSKEMNGI